MNTVDLSVPLPSKLIYKNIYLLVFFLISLLILVLDPYDFVLNLVIATILSTFIGYLSVNFDRRDIVYIGGVWAFIFFAYYLIAFIFGQIVFSIFFDVDFVAIAVQTLLDLFLIIPTVVSFGIIARKLRLIFIEMKGYNYEEGDKLSSGIIILFIVTLFSLIFVLIPSGDIMMNSNPNSITILRNGFLLKTIQLLWYSIFWILLTIVLIGQTIKKYKSDSKSDYIDKGYYQLRIVVIVVIAIGTFVPLLYVFNDTWLNILNTFLNNPNLTSIVPDLAVANAYVAIDGRFRTMMLIYYFINLGVIIFMLYNYERVSYSDVYIHDNIS